MIHLHNSLGLAFSWSEAGSLASIHAGPIRIGDTPSSWLARSQANVYLRRRGGTPLAVPLFGPESPSRYRATEGALQASGSWQDIDYTCELELARDALAWQWRVELASRVGAALELDLIHTQSVGLKTAGPGAVNHAYVSQYLERRVLEHGALGRVVCCRQNMREASGHPWLLLACAERAHAASTDGLQFYGNGFRASGVPAALGLASLPGELAGENALVALQTEPFVLPAGGSLARSFVARYVPDHPLATSEDDLAGLAGLVARLATAPQESRRWAELPAVAPAAQRLQNARLLPVEDLTGAELAEHFGTAWRHVEARDGELLSFFRDDPGPCHVVLRAKEVRVNRPHGHILQAHGGSVPDARTLSTTAFACGVFNAHLSQGNTNFDTLLSVCASPATPNLEGQRIFVRLADGEYLLGVPSAFEMGLGHCRWIYKHRAGCLSVCTWAAPHDPCVHLCVEVLRGAAVGLTVSHQFDPANGWTFRESGPGELTLTPGATSLLRTHVPGARFRMQVHGDAQLCCSEVPAPSDAGESPTLLLDVPTCHAFAMSFVGELAGPARTPRLTDPAAQQRADAAEATRRWQELSRGLTLRGPRAIAAIAEILPWYGMNALTHYLTPFGLEQFSGAAWGTRDVCQGPIDLLLGQDQLEATKEVLRRVFSHQNADGGLPQWWMFDRYRAVRADGAHGDVLYWCILALCSYVRASGDYAFLCEPLPFHDADAAPVSEHVERILARVTASFVPGTALVQFGGGDWNDSLQPVSDELARRLVSSWTVQMCHQALDEYRALCERAGDAARAEELAALCARVHADFQRELVRDGEVAGYGRVADDGSIALLLHPRDTTTGVLHSLLPMNRGVISGMFTKDQAEAHLALIARHLTGPDGARLMDRPLRYRGGPQTLFQRAESSCYFGREIGLMYVHEHLRYAEALARMGRAEAFLHALRQAIPVGYGDVVPQGDLRQANCYYSSSDVLFPSRYDADARYDDVLSGKLPLVGGWRVYSSGPGIFIGHVLTRLLGLRVRDDALVIDPVLAPSLDGLEAALRFRGRALTVRYRVEGAGFGPSELVVNGRPMTFAREPNPYRTGGAVLPLSRFLAALDADENTLSVTV